MSGVVIKAGEARALSQGLYSLDLRDVSEQATSLLSSARAEAARITDEARRQAEDSIRARRQQAQREGYEEGYAAGKAAGHEEALKEARVAFAGQQQEVVSALTSLVREFVARRERLYLAARRDVVVLAIAVASRILKKVAHLEDVISAGVLEACEEALGLLAEPTEAVIRTHPDDWALVERFSTEPAESLRSSRHVRVIEDASVERGGVVVETADSQIDATIASRLERIADELVTDWRRRMQELSIEP